MKAVRLLEYGGQLVFNDVPTPTIARDEILVKIRSTAINHLDLVEASGTARQILPIDLPWIPGHEFSGVVEQIGSDVAACAPGDAVFGTTSGMGAYAEYLAVKAAAIARKPSNLSFEEAASVPVASQTAWQGIFTHGHLEKGQTILIHGGAGAVGAYAVQLASHAGATVIATARGDDEAYLNSIGASRVIDYRESEFERVLREKVDVAFDLIGGDTQRRSFLVLKEGGHLVSAIQPVSQEETARHRVSRDDEARAFRRRARQNRAAAVTALHVHRPAIVAFVKAGNIERGSYDDHLRDHRQHTTGPVYREAGAMDSSRASETGGNRSPAFTGAGPVAGSAARAPRG